MTSPPRCSRSSSVNWAYHVGSSREPPTDELADRFTRAPARRNARLLESLGSV